MLDGKTVVLTEAPQRLDTWPDRVVSEAGGASKDQHVLSCSGGWLWRRRRWPATTGGISPPSSGVSSEVSEEPSAGSGLPSASSGRSSGCSEPAPSEPAALEPAPIGFAPEPSFDPPAAGRPSSPPMRPGALVVEEPGVNGGTAGPELSVDCEQPSTKTPRAPQLDHRRMPHDTPGERRPQPALATTTPRLRPRARFVVDLSCARVARPPMLPPERHTRIDGVHGLRGVDVQGVRRARHVRVGERRDRDTRKPARVAQVGG